MSSEAVIKGGKVGAGIAQDDGNNVKWMKDARSRPYTCQNKQRDVVKSCDGVRY